MLERVSDPGTYQAFQHFITDAPWSADAVWRQLRATDSRSHRRADSRRHELSEAGTLLGRRRAAVLRHARQDRQLPGRGDGGAVDGRARVDARRALYLPEAWLTPEPRTRARIPAAVRGQQKWRLALTLLRQVRASGITVTAVLGDAEFGDNATLRRTLHRAQLPYALGVSSTLTVFVGTPALVAPSPRAGLGRPRSRPTLAPRRRRPRGARLGRGPARTGVARACRGATARSRPWRARFCATARDPGARLARPPPRPRGLAAVRARPRHRAIAPSTTWSTCRRPRRCARWCGWRINAGRSSSSIRN